MKSLESAMVGWGGLRVSGLGKNITPLKLLQKHSKLYCIVLQLVWTP